MIKENLIAGIVGIVFVCAIAIPLLIFTGCFEGEEPTPPVVTPSPSPTPVVTPRPTPPLEMVSDKVREIKIRIAVIDMDITFEDGRGRSFSKLNDGRTRIKMETFRDSEKWSERIEDIKAGEEFRDIPLPGCASGIITLKITITLPNGKTTRTSTEFNRRKRNNILLYEKGYEKGEEEARIGYSPDIPWDESAYYRDGYTDGYVGATPRYTFSYIRKTITIE